MKGLTSKQKEILEFIESFGETSGMAPTVYEIAEYFKIKTSTVFAHLRALQKKNYMTRSSKARSISLTKPMHHQRRPSGLRSIPVVSVNDEKLKSPERELFCDASFLRRASSISDIRNLFAIKVHNSDLHSRGILDGDIAIIRKHPAAIRKDDIVLASINGTPVLRRCSRITDECVEMVSDDPRIKPMVYPLEDAPLRGVVISVQRSM